MQNVNINIIQYISIIGSICFLLFIIYLVRRKIIKEEYSLLWILFSIIFIIFSFWRKGLDVISTLIGIASPPIAFLLILIMSIFFILLQFSTVISKLTEQNKNLIQEIGILKFEIKKFEKKNKKYRVRL